MARTAFVAWARETAAQLRLTVATVKTLAVAATVTAFAFGVLLTVLSGGSGPAQEQGLTAGKLSFIMGGAFLTVSLLTALFAMLAPQRHALATVLEMLPVSRPAAFAGLQAPVLVLSYLLALSLVMPSIAELWRAADGRAVTAAVGTVFLLLFMFCSQVILLAVFQGLGYLFRRWLRLPRYYALTFSGASCFGLGVLLVGTDVLPVPSSLEDHATGVRDFAPHRVWSRALAPLWTGGVLSWPDLLIGVLWVLVPFLLMLVVSRTDIDNQEDVALRVLANTSLPSRRFLAATYVDALQLIRTHQFVVLLLLLTLSLGGVLLLSRHAEFGFIAPLVAPGLAVAPLALGMQSYGVTAAAHWVLRHLTARPAAWAMPKFCAAAVVALVVSGVFVGTLLAAGLLLVSQWPTLIGSAALLWLAAMIGGVLVPFSREQPLGSSATGFTVFLLYLLSSTAASWAAPKFGWAFGGIAVLGEITATVLVAAVLGIFLAGLAERVSEDA
ncbi:hypothetical protein RF644_05815 [Kocuria sp. CPCC 205258]|uniref:hypothetical protein n=1 Tax=Kocuria sp. CPCC 205258 TaxID=3073552 RepID=UPI0034D4F401